MEYEYGLYILTTYSSSSNVDSRLSQQLCWHRGNQVLQQTSRLDPSVVEQQGVLQLVRIPFLFESHVDGVLADVVKLGAGLWF